MRGNVKNSFRLQSQTSLNFQDYGDISRAWDSIRENINILAEESLRYCESKHHEQWCDEDCSELVD
jgi:hypothetical protein